MATHNWGLDLTFTAAVDLSASQYYFVKAGSIAGEVTIANTAGGSVLGVLQNDPKAAEEATVRVLGSTRVRSNSESAASAITFGNLVKCGSHGMAVGYNSNTASTFAAGIALESVASGSGQYIEMLLTYPSY